MPGANDPYVHAAPHVIMIFCAASRPLSAGASFT